MRTFLCNLFVVFAVLLLPKLASASYTGSSSDMLSMPSYSPGCTGPQSVYTLYDSMPTLDPEVSLDVTVPYFRMYGDCPGMFSPTILLREQESRLTPYLRSIDLFEEETGTVVGYGVINRWSGNAGDRWTSVRLHGSFGVPLGTIRNYSLRLVFDAPARRIGAGAGTDPVSVLEGVLDILLPEDYIGNPADYAGRVVEINGHRYITQTELLVEHVWLSAVVTQPSTGRFLLRM